VSFLLFKFVLSDKRLEFVSYVIFNHDLKYTSHIIDIFNRKCVGVSIFVVKSILSANLEINKNLANSFIMYLLQVVAQYTTDGTTNQQMVRIDV